MRREKTKYQYKQKNYGSMSRIFFKYLQIRTIKFWKGLSFIIYDLIVLDFFSSRRNVFFKKKDLYSDFKKLQSWGF